MQTYFFSRSKQLVIKNIMDIPMFALFWGWIRVYSYLGSSVFMELRLDVWCALCLQRKEETSVASINQWATRSDSEDMEVKDGLLFGLGCRSIMITVDWIWYIHTVYIGETKHLGQALTNGCTAALVTIWDLVRG